MRKAMAILAGIAAIVLAPMPAFAHHNTSQSRAMTMTFQAQSPALLEGLAVGDHVRFRFQQVGSDHVIDQIVKQ